MSYILDALKKSEKERQKKNVPDLLTVQEPVFNKKKKTTVWPYIIIAVLGLNIGLLGYLLGPGKSQNAKVDNAIVQQQKELKTIETQKPEVAKVEISATEFPVKEVSKPKPVLKAKETKIAAVSIQQKKPLPEKAVQAHKGQEMATVQSVQPPMKKEIQSAQTQTMVAENKASAEASFSHEQKPVQTDTPPEPDRIYNKDELPLSIQQKLPAVNVSIFMYSDDPASRMVRINGQTYREGQKISEDLTLERIMPNGIVFHYKNFRFQVGQQTRN
jgi:general secretion pathway protein B